MQLGKWLVAATLAAGVCQQALASPELARARNCMSCHGVANKIVGPSFRDIAKRYQGNKESEPMLAERIRKGGAGHWGVVAMPANAQVSEAEAKTLVTWILQQK